MNKKEANRILKSFIEKMQDDLFKEIVSLIKKSTKEDFSKSEKPFAYYSEIKKAEKDYLTNGKIKFLLEDKKFFERFYVGARATRWYLEFEIPQNVKDLEGWTGFSKAQKKYIKEDILNGLLSKEEIKKRKENFLKEDFYRLFHGAFFQLENPNMKIYKGNKSIYLLSKFLSEKGRYDFNRMRMVLICEKGDSLYLEAERKFLKGESFEQAFEPIKKAIDFAQEHYQDLEQEKDEFCKFLAAQMKKRQVDLAKGLFNFFTNPCFQIG